MVTTVGDTGCADTSSTLANAQDATQVQPTQIPLSNPTPTAEQVNTRFLRPDCVNSRPAINPTPAADFALHSCSVNARQADDLGESSLSPPHGGMNVLPTQAKMGHPDCVNSQPEIDPTRAWHRCRAWHLLSPRRPSPTHVPCTLPSSVWCRRRRRLCSRKSGMPSGVFRASTSVRRLRLTRRLPLRAVPPRRPPVCAAPPARRLGCVSTLPVLLLRVMWDTKSHGYAARTYEHMSALN